MPRHAPRSLGIWSWIVLGLLAAHDLTHLLDDGLDTGAGELALVAAPQWAALAVLTAVVLRGDRARSGAAAVLLGTGTALGVAVVHLLPFAPASYWDLEPSSVSWLAAWAPLAAGVVLASLGWPQWRRPAMSASMAT